MDPDHDGRSDVDTDRIHFTAGVGAELRRGWTIDGAVHLAETISEAMLSLTFRP